MQKYKRNYQYFRYPKRNLHFFFLIVTFLFLCTGNVDILINIKTEQLIVKWNKYFGIFKTKAGVACSFMTYAKKVKNFSLLHLPPTLPNTQTPFPTILYMGVIKQWAKNAESAEM